MKPDNDSENMVPENVKGKPSDAEESIELSTGELAVKVFENAKKLLCDINQWSTYSRVKLASTWLTDSEGNVIHRLPLIGDFIRTDLVGPGSKEGDGYDWVQIIAIEDLSDSGGGEEMFSIKVRPSANPLSKNQDEIAHFFNRDATNTFIIIRLKNTITAAVRGRNELPNTETNNKIDKLRNSAVSLISAIGFSAVQWKLFVKGLLNHATNIK